MHTPLPATSAPVEVAATPPRGLRRITLTQWILISMIIGIVIGAIFREDARAIHGGFAATDLKVLSNIFLRMIKSLIVPLLFSTLVVGIAGHGADMKSVGKLALRSIIYFEIVTTLALVVGLIAVNWAKPGVGVTLEGATTENAAEYASRQPTISSVLEHTVPDSFFKAAADNEVLQVVFFAILFAVALSQVQGRPKEFMLGFCESLSEIMFKFVALVMAFAPIGIGAAIAVTVSKSGLGVLINLAQLVGTLYAALIVFIILVLVPVALIARVPMQRFIRAVKEPYIIAFSTASSEAALPRAMQAMEAIGVPRRIVAFVMPTGYSFNLDGSTLYLAVASIFATQAAGIDVPLSGQIVMMLTLMLTSKGVAAVPRASIVILFGVLSTFHPSALPAIAVILGVDAIMDMARTSVNLLGNCLATVVMARWEGQFDDHALDNPTPEQAKAAGL